MKSRHAYLEDKSKPLIAVYDLLREDLILNILIDKTSTFLGQFSTLPEFCLMDIGKKDTGVADIVLLENFNLSVVMDVYEVTETFLEELDEYYEYFDDMDNFSSNIRKKIQTPYGEAYIYVNNRIIKEGKIIPSGDLVDYLDYSGAANVPTHKFKELTK